MPTPDWLPLTSWNMRKIGPLLEHTSASSPFKLCCDRQLKFLFYRNPFCEQYLTQAKFWVNNHAHIVQGNGLCNTRYLCYLLNSMDLSGYVTGSAQPKLSQANLNAVTLILPAISIQEKVAECLYMFDKKISVNEQINDNLAA